MKHKELKKNFDLLLTGDLSNDRLSALESYALRDANAARELDQVKKLRAALYRTARNYRQTSYPGDLAADVIERTTSVTMRPILTRRRSYALAAVLVVICSLLLILRINQPQHSMLSGFPSISIMADINRSLTEFKIANRRHLTDWSMKANLSMLNPGEINITGFWIPDRPAPVGSPITDSNNQEGVEL
jgi:hypothetical protein